MVFQHSPHPAGYLLEGRAVFYKILCNTAGMFRLRSYRISQDFSHVNCSHQYVLNKGVILMTALPPLPAQSVWGFLVTDSPLRPFFTVQLRDETAGERLARYIRVLSG